jgi:hypothetical protein
MNRITPALVHKQHNVQFVVGVSALCALGLVLTACGGHDLDSERSGRQSDASAASRLTSQTAATLSLTRAETDPSSGLFKLVPAPLVDDEGLARPSDPSTVPRDRGAHTRHELYALPNQAAALERSLQGGLLRVDIDCCSVEAIERLIAQAHGVKTADDPAHDAPAMVSGRDLRQAAAVANQLADAGHNPVWLVVPQ